MLAFFCFLCVDGWNITEIADFKRWPLIDLFLQICYSGVYLQFYFLSLLIVPRLKMPHQLRSIVRAI